MKRAIAIIAIVVAAALIGCDADPRSGRGFTLPDGDTTQGRQTFVELQCHICHTVEGVEAFPHVGEPPVSVALGGTVTRIRTYGELVTSIINPSHRMAQGYPTEAIQTEDGQSRMTNYNNVMTVSELIDLVAFLQSKYELVPVEPTDYPIFRMAPSTALLVP